MSDSPLQFRFWHAIAKRYVDPARYAILGDGRLAYYNDEDGEWKWDIVALDQTPVKPEQWTGVHDKTGRKIYDRDIVEVNDRLSLITRRDGHWGCTWSDYHLGTCWFMGGGPRVVGNANEHPELLEKALKP